MRYQTIAGILFFFVLRSTAQNSYIDSLAGFDAALHVNVAQSKNYNSEEINYFLRESRRDFIKKKYNLNTIPSFTSKYSSSSIAVAPCVDEDFETYPPGQYATGTFTTWAIDQRANTSLSTLCPTTTLTWGFTNSFSVLATPFSDNVIGTIPNSPLGGAKIAGLNRFAGNTNGTRMKQTFSVTSSNCVFNYAYLGVINSGGHSCCDNGFSLFNFYDCNNNLIGPLSDTISSPSFSGNCSSLTGWSYNSSTANYYTPTWIIKFADLSPYIGSCVTVEVISSNCTGGAHLAYLYFDALCSNVALNINNSLSANTYTSCLPTATLSSVGCASVTWNGPSNSGITNVLSPSITASVSGIYTLSSSNGTVTNTRTISLTVNNIPNVNITSTSQTLCVGQSATLQASAGSSYTWSTFSASSAVVVQPPYSMNYSVLATNSLGCISAATASITVYQLPILQVTTSSPILCVGKTATLSVQSDIPSNFLWSNQQTTSLIAVTPQSSAQYSVIATTSAGCQNTISIPVQVVNYPVAIINTSKDSLCIGQSVNINAVSTGTNAFVWNTGSNLVQFSTSPTLTTVYSLSVTNFGGCSSSTSRTVFVYPLPQIVALAIPDSVCKGSPSTIQVNGSGIGNTIWNSGAAANSFTTSPTFFSVYTATVTSSHGCKAVASTSLAVLNLPQVSVFAPDPFICPGENVQLTALSNELIFKWVNGPATNTFNINPQTTTEYTVQVTDKNGCVSSAKQQITVSDCLGIGEHNATAKLIEIYPNPVRDHFVIQSDHKTLNVQLVNALGQLIKEIDLNSENDYKTSITGLTPGEYFVRAGKYTEKIIVLPK